MNNAELKRLGGPATTASHFRDAMRNRFGSLPVLSRVHWVRPELREDKPPAEYAVRCRTRTSNSGRLGNAT
jgi:hypothetical protein